MIHAYLLFAVLAGLSSGVLAVVVWRGRRVPGAGFLAIMALGAAIWSATAVAELLAPTLGGKLLAARLTYIGTVLVPWSWLLFALAYTGRAPRQIKRLAERLAVLPLMTVLFVFLSPSLPLLWLVAHVANASGDPQPLLVEHAWWFWVNVAYSYSCMLVGSALLLQAVFRIVRPLTTPGLTIVLAVTLPWLANALTITGVLPLKGLDLTPPTIAASALLIAYAALHLRALDVHPGVVLAARDAVFESMRDGLLVVDAQGTIVSANQAAEALLLAVDAAAPSLLGRPVSELLRCSDEEPAACLSLDEKAEGGGHSAEVRGAGKDGPALEVVVSRLGRSSQVSGYVLVVRDVTERTRMREELLHRALHDELTGLPNRRLLEEYLEELLDLAKRRDEQLSLLMIDLDHFKDINDTFGHETGDELLKVMAKRLLDARRQGDLVVRLSGDEFAVVLPACSNHDAVNLATDLRGQLTAPIELHNQHVSVSASVGIATSPVHGRSAAVLLRHADVAVYAAKGTLDGVAAYQTEHDPNSPKRLALLSELRSAIENGRLELHFQPEIALADERVLRLEALARWRRQNGEVIPPDEFIPLAGQHVLLAALTRWALAAALGHAATLQRAGLAIPVAVNLSALDLQDQTLPKRIAHELEQSGMQAEHLWLEVTETSVMRDPERSRHLLSELRELGVSVAIDDFGTGQSSLSYLRTLPADDVKIDRSFVRRLASDSLDQIIVHATVQLAHDLGLSVTAEGVEDAEAFEHLRECGCDHAQGYFIARPMPFEALLGWLGPHRLSTGHIDDLVAASAKRVISAAR